MKDSATIVLAIVLLVVGIAAIGFARTSVDPAPAAKIEAPFATIERDGDRTKVKAPFVDIDVRDKDGPDAKDD